MNIDSINQTITLSDGYKMPMFGLGCFNTHEKEAEQAVSFALKEGYRLFDTAEIYQTERAVGNALRKSGLPRNQYFVVTKLLSMEMGYENAKRNLRKSLETLGLDHVDLFLIHTPRLGKVLETWKAFVELKEEGLTKSIGVSNFNVQFLKPLIQSGLEVPAVNQIELHPWNQQTEAVRFCMEHNIALMGYCPLARGTMFKDGKYPSIDKLSQQHKKSKAQILLRWSLQKGFITIPKSSNAERIKENAQVFDWTLSRDDMKSIMNITDIAHISVANYIMHEPWTG